MFRLALRIVLSVLAAAPAYAGTTVRLLETYPPEGDIEVAPNQNVYLRIAYATDSPTRIWVRPYLHGQPAPAGSSPSPSYSGRGELLGWFFLMQDAGEVDEVRVTAGDGSVDSTRPIATWPLHVRARRAASAPAPEPEWVTTLRAQAQAAAREARVAAASAPRSASSLGDAVLLGGFFLAVPVLGIFGLLAPLWGLWRWRGGWRLAAAIPAVAMGFVVLRILVDTARDPTAHNLWPFEILMVGGVSSLVILALIVAPITGFAPRPVLRRTRPGPRAADPRRTRGFPPSR